MKFQKFNLSTVISYIFFIIFITLLLSSALWFYNSSLKTIEYETKNYFKQNNKIVEIILNGYANNLSDLTKQIVNKYDFINLNIQSNQTQEYLEKMINSSIADKLDVMFFKPNNGEIIDVSLTVFDSKNIIKNLLKHKSEESFFFKSIKQNGHEDIALIGSTEEIIDPNTGRILGRLYVGIILNDNLSVITDINDQLKIESLSFILNNKVITSTSNLNNIQDIKLNELKLNNNLITKRSRINIKDNPTPLEIIYIVKNDVYEKLFSDFLFKLFILITLALILFIISNKMIKSIIETPLNKLMNFALNSRKHNDIKPFKQTRISEFNNLGLNFEQLIKEIKEINNGLEVKIKERTYELEESNDELNFTIENLKKTQDKLVEVEKMASLGNLVAGVAHEINTPVGIGLTGITHFLELTQELEKKYDKDEVSQEYFENYIKTSKELAKLINANLERTTQLVQSFKQVAVDQTNEEKREFNLKEYVDSILFSINNITKQTKLNINLKCDDDIEINSYPGVLSQIITNLILNSVNHAYNEQEEGNILIEFTKNGNQILFIYKDDGEGIEEKDLEKIFDPFFTTNREKGGTGLGLHIIYNIITHTLKGSIKCISNKGKGVKFIIKFNV